MTPEFKKLLKGLAKLADEYEDSLDNRVILNLTVIDPDELDSDLCYHWNGQEMKKVNR